MGLPWDFMRLCTKEISWQSHSGLLSIGLHGFLSLYYRQCQMIKGIMSWVAHVILQKISHRSKYTIMMVSANSRYLFWQWYFLMPHCIITFYLYCSHSELMCIQWWPVSHPSISFITIIMTPIQVKKHQSTTANPAPYIKWTLKSILAMCLSAVWSWSLLEYVIDVDWKKMPSWPVKIINKIVCI